MSNSQPVDGSELEGLLEKSRREERQASRAEDKLDIVFDVLLGAKSGTYGRKWDAGRYFSAAPTNFLDSPAFDDSKITLYWQRWLMLFILFLLSMLTDWTCFSLSSIMPVVESSFTGMHVSNLVTIFLIANVVSSLCESAVVARLGLRRGILVGAFFLLTGSLLRSGLPFIATLNYTSLKIGTVLVGFSQPYFQNTIAQLAAAWFPPHERTLATAIGFLSSVLGVMLSFLIGTCLVREPEELYHYLLLISAVALLGSLLALFVFESSPPTPPSRSAHEKLRLAGSDKFSSTGFIMQVADILRVPGFAQAMLAFVMCDCILNVVITFMSSLLNPLGYSQLIVGVCGASYQLAIVIGSLTVGYWVDRTKEHHKGTMLCFAVSVLCLLSLGLDNTRTDAWIMIPAIMILGLAIGPIQPCAADLSVEVSYPADENTVFTILQLVGNSLAAASVPIFRLCRNREANSYMSSIYYLVSLGVLGLASMATFSAPLKRMDTDRRMGNSSKPSACTKYTSLPLEERDEEGDTDVDDEERGLEARLNKEEEEEEGVSSEEGETTEEEEDDGTGHGTTTATTQGRRRNVAQ